MFYWLTQELYTFIVFLCLGTCIIVHLAQIKRILESIESVNYVAVLQLMELRAQYYRHWGEDSECDDGKEEEPVDDPLTQWEKMRLLFPSQYTGLVVPFMEADKTNK